MTSGLPPSILQYLLAQKQNPGLVSDGTGLTGQGPIVDPTNPDNTNSGLTVDNSQVPTSLPGAQAQAPPPDSSGPPSSPQPSQTSGPPPQVQTQQIPSTAFAQTSGPPPQVQTQQIPSTAFAGALSAPPSAVTPQSVASSPSVPSAVTPESLISSSASRLSTPPPTPPPPPPIWRQIVGGLVSAAPLVGPALAPLAEYGPKGIQQNQNYQRQLAQYQQQEGQVKPLTDLARIGVDLEKERNDRDTRNASKDQQIYTALLNEQDNFLNKTHGQIVPAGTAIPPGYFKVTSSPLDGGGTMRIAPDASTVDRLHLDGRQVAIVTPAIAQLIPELGYKGGEALPTTTYDAILQIAKQKLENPNIFVGEAKNDVTGVVTYTLINKNTNQVTKVINTAPGANVPKPSAININNKNASDPALVDRTADNVFTSPRTFDGINSAAMKQEVADRFTQKYGLPPPSKISGQMQTQEDMSQAALTRINDIETLASDPVIQQRLGSIMGRVGNMEQTAGSTVGLSPQDSQKVQRFRSALTYLFLGDGKAIFGAKPPQKLMEMLQSTSPNVKEEMSMLRGSIQAAKDAAGENMTAAEKLRFAGKTRPGFVPGQPIQLPGQSNSNSPASGKPIYTVDGGKTWHLGSPPRQ